LPSTCNPEAGAPLLLLLDELALEVLLAVFPLELDALLVLPAGLAPPAPPLLPLLLLELDIPVAAELPRPPVPLPLFEFAADPPQPVPKEIVNPATSAKLRPWTKGHLQRDCVTPSPYANAVQLNRRGNGRYMRRNAPCQVVVARRRERRGVSRDLNAWSCTRDDCGAEKRNAGPGSGRGSWVGVTNPFGALA
jgi:hypothetical protein